MKDDEMELLVRSFDDELAAADQMRLDDLLAASDEARTADADLRRIRAFAADGAARAFSPGFADRVMAATATAEAASAEAAPRRPLSSRPSRAPLPRKVGRRRAGVVALAAAALVAAGILWLMMPRTTTVPRGEMRTVSLSDGSTVELSGGSSLRYRNFWGRESRSLELDGEAYFDVARSEKPFVVETFNARVTVLGTSFNVRAWRNDLAPQTAVAVASGRVAVTPKKLKAPNAPGAPEPSNDPQLEPRRGDAVVVLQPGQATAVDSSAARPAMPAALDRVTTWRTGGLAFADQPLSNVFNSLERRFDVDVETSDPGIRRRVVTYLNPNPRSAEDVLSDICHTLDLRFRRTATGYEILPN